MKNGKRQFSYLVVVFVVRSIQVEMTKYLYGIVVVFASLVTMVTLVLLLSFRRDGEGIYRRRRIGPCLTCFQKVIT